MEEPERPLTLEETLSRLDDAIHQQEGLLADARQQIASEQATFDNECSLSSKLATTLKQAQARLSVLNAKVAALATAAGQATVEMQGVESYCQDQRQRVQALQGQLQAASARLLELQTQMKSDHDERKSHTLTVEREKAGAASGKKVQSQ